MTASSPPTLFAPLEQADFQTLEYSVLLKGLLKPFKGKGDLRLWASQCDALRDGLVRFAQRLETQATRPPFDLLPVTLTHQSTGAGTIFLRWRNPDRSVMGTALWARLLERPGTSGVLAKALYELELQRISLNMQISLTHTLARQAVACARKMEWAERIYGHTTSPRATTSPEGPPA